LEPNKAYKQDIIPKLEENDFEKYSILDASLTVDCDLKKGRAEYSLDILIQKKTTHDVFWFSRFDKEGEALFTGVDIKSDNFETTHENKYTENNFLSEIKLTIPATERADSKIRFTLGYSKRIKPTTISKFGKNQRLLLNLFNAFASNCDEFKFTIRIINPQKVNIKSVDCPGEKEIGNKEVIIIRKNLAPRQFSPITILIDRGYYTTVRIILIYIIPIVGIILSLISTLI